MSVRELIGIKMREQDVKDGKNPLLDKVFDKFWQQTVPELLEEQGN